MKKMLRNETETKCFEKPFISVVIPAYKAGKTIKRCIKSVQSALGKVSFEVIAVDNASPDNTVRRIEELSEKYANLKLIRLEQNFGPGHARNVGLKAAGGEYVWFVDADDEIESANFINLNIAQTCEGADIVMFRYSRAISGHFGKKQWLAHDEAVMASRPSDTFTAEQLPSVLTTTCAVWNKWFRRQSILETGVEFPDTFVGEDLVFMTANLCSAKSIKFIDKTLYTYHLDASQISKMDGVRRLDTIKAHDMCEKWLTENKVSAGIMNSWNLCKSYRLLNTHKAVRKELRSVIKENLNSHIKSLNNEMFTLLLAHPFNGKELKDIMLQSRGLNQKMVNKILPINMALFKLWRPAAFAASWLLFLGIGLISMSFLAQPAYSDDLYILGGGGGEGRLGAYAGGYGGIGAKSIYLSGGKASDAAGGGGGGYIGTGVPYDGEGYDAVVDVAGAGGLGYGGAENGGNGQGDKGGKGGDAVYNGDVSADNVYLIGGDKSNSDDMSGGAGGNAILNANNIIGSNLYITAGFGSTAKVNVGQYGADGAVNGNISLKSGEWPGKAGLAALNAGAVYAKIITGNSANGGRVEISADYVQASNYTLTGDPGVIGTLKSVVNVFDTIGYTTINLYNVGVYDSNTDNGVLFRRINIGGNTLAINTGGASELNFGFEKINILASNTTIDSDVPINFNFSGQTLEFQTDAADWNGAVPMLYNVGAPINIADNASIKVNVSGGALNVGDSITLIDGDAYGTNGKIKGFDGVFLAYDLDLVYASLTATVTGKGLNPQTKAFSEGRAAVTALLSDGSDFASSWGIANAVSMTQDTHGLAVFGGLSYSNAKYDTGSHVDVKGVSVLGGVAKKFVFAPGVLTAGLFVEYGSANFDSENTFSGFSDVKGSGDAGYAGGGLLGRYDFNKNESGGNYWYGEGSLRVGSADNSFEADNVGALSHVKYDAEALYYGLHLGGGRILKLNEKINLDAYGKYFFVHQNGKDITLSNSDPLKFNGMDSHRVRGGARGNYKINEIWSPYLGLAAEYELDGKVDAEIYNTQLDEVSLTGFRGIGEIGVCAEIKSFRVDLGVRGFAGKKQGFDASLRLIYFFGKS